MNLRPGSLPRLLVCHSRRAGFSDFWPTIGLLTTASLKWSTTAAMANAPPSRSYSLDSVISCLLDGFLEASHRVHRWLTPSVGGHHALPLLRRTAPARIPALGAVRAPPSESYRLFRNWTFTRDDLFLAEGRVRRHRAQGRTPPSLRPLPAGNGGGAGVARPPPLVRNQGVIFETNASVLPN